MPLPVKDVHFEYYFGSAYAGSFFPVHLSKVESRTGSIHSLLIVRWPVTPPGHPKDIGDNEVFDVHIAIWCLYVYLIGFIILISFWSFLHWNMYFTFLNK